MSGKETLEQFGSCGEGLEDPRSGNGTGRELATGRITWPCSATWPSTPCKTKDQKAPCAAGSNAPDGTTPTSTA
jgi:hypothetical protein